MTVYTKVSGLAAWSENCNRALCLWVQLYRYFVSQSSEFCRHNPLCCFSTNACCYLLRYQLSPENLDAHSYTKFKFNNKNGVVYSISEYTGFYRRVLCHFVSLSVLYVQLFQIKDMTKGTNH